MQLTTDTADDGLYRLSLDVVPQVTEGAPHCSLQ
jgi:hypothetical protein